MQGEQQEATPLTERRRPLCSLVWPACLTAPTAGQVRQYGSRKSACRSRMAACPRTALQSRSFRSRTRLASTHFNRPHGEIPLAVFVIDFSPPFRTQVRTVRVLFGSFCRSFCSSRRAMVVARRSSVGSALGVGRVVNVRDLRAAISSSINEPEDVEL